MALCLCVTYPDDSMLQMSLPVLWTQTLIACLHWKVQSAARTALKLLASLCSNDIGTQPTCCSGYTPQCLICLLLGLDSVSPNIITCDSVLQKVLQLARGGMQQL